MLANVKEILTKAKDEGYAVGAFNTVNLETTQAIIQAAQELKSPVIVQITEKTMEFAGGREIFNIVKNMIEFYADDIPVGIHLDHGKSFEVVERAVDIGFGSVMYDGSRKEFSDNLEMTKKIVEYCHERKVVVQGELGAVPYIGEMEITEVDWEKYMTKPEEAERFVKETGVDSLAVAIGNAHGFFKERDIPDYDRLEVISERTKIPLVLHGSSDWETDRVAEVIKRGVACFNVDTGLRMAYVNHLSRALEDKSNVSFDVRKLMAETKDAVKEVVKEKIKMYGSDGRAE